MGPVSLSISPLQVRKPGVCHYTFTLSEERMRLARDEALRIAVGDAWADADTVAAAVGMKIPGVRDVGVGDVSPPVVYDRYATAGISAKTVQAPIQPGENRVSARASSTSPIE
jgi:uncharacterized protein YggE